jgi:flagellar biosynthesis GTPase FlhF
MKDANGMKIKSYFAKTVDEAISKARVELGSDALLLNTRKIADTGAGGGYEVVMGIAGPAPAPKVTAPATPKPATRATAAAAAAPKSSDKSPGRTPENPEVASEMEKLRSRMDELQSLLVQSANNAWAAQRSVPEVADVYARLIAAEVDPALGKDTADGDRRLLLVHRPGSRRSAESLEGFEIRARARRTIPANRTREPRGSPSASRRERSQRCRRRAGGTHRQW